MLRIESDEVKKIEKVFKDIRTMTTREGDNVLKRTTKGSKWYLIEDNTYRWYLNKCKYYFEMSELIDGELVRVDGNGRPIDKKDLRYLDKCIRENRNRK